METKKCSCIKHEEAKAIYYCTECKIYMCNKCENHHSELFPTHHKYTLDKDIKSIFTGFCKEENHLEKLEFFCKTHNQLCCASCIIKIKTNGKGKHSNCDICILKDIKEEKQKQLKNNINILEELSVSLVESINKLKTIYEKLNENKEELKLKIQKVFTKIRNTINEREDILLSEVDKQFNDNFISEHIIKENENLPTKIQLSLEKGKNIDKEWNDENKLNSIINDCINIENNIKEITVIKNNIKNINDNKIKIKFYPDEENKMEKFLEIIKFFGKVGSNIWLEESNIFSSADNYDFIFEEIEKNNDIIKSSKLIYRATRDGDSYDNFFNKCNGINNIVLLIKSNNNSIFGGFTKVGFKKVSDKKYKDDLAFVFSFDKKKIYPIIKGKDAIRCCDCCCPQFCDNTIYLYKNFLSQNNNFVNSINDNYEGFTIDYELNNGTKNFTVIELEVHQIFFL